MIGKAALAALVLCAGALAACGDDGDAPAVVIDNARARFTTTDLGAVYFDVRVTGAGDALVAAATEIADDAQLHEIATVDGSAMMREVAGGIAIAPGGSVSLRPGGYHVMLLGVAEPPPPGETFALTLEFERAGRVTVDVAVEAFE